MKYVKKVKVNADISLAGILTVWICCLLCILEESSSEDEVPVKKPSAKSKQAAASAAPKKDSQLLLDLLDCTSLYITLCPIIKVQRKSI